MAGKSDIDILFALIKQAREEVKKLKAVRTNSEKLLEKVLKHAEKVKNNMEARTGSQSLQDKARTLKQRLKSQTTMAKFAPVAVLSTLPGNFNAESLSAADTHENLIRTETAAETPSSSESDKTYAVSFEEIAAAYNRGTEVTSLKSVWDISALRETANEKNPAGSVSPSGRYFGYVQYNRFFAENMVLFALLRPEYKEIGRKFMTPGYAASVKKFAAETVAIGNSAYRSGNRTQREARNFIRKDFRAVFEKVGADPAYKETFLQLQKDFASAVYADLMGANAKTIDKALRRFGVSLAEVEPAIIGMWMEHGIAKGNCRDVLKTLKGPLNYINSARYVDEYRRQPGIICDNPEAVKKHLGKKHSLTTLREVSLMLGDSAYTELMQKTERIIKAEKMLKTLPLTPAKITDALPQPAPQQLSAAEIKNMQRSIAARISRKNRRSR